MNNAPLKTILIVDDTAASAAALEIACASIPGVEVSVAPSARHAVRILNDGGREIRAVITDVHMPGMDGFELIQFIRASTKHHGVPVIVVSADTDPDTPERSRRLGADAYFPKPCSPAAVRLKLEQLLHDFRGSR